jgi:hypothetical protein
MKNKLFTSLGMVLGFSILLGGMIVIVPGQQSPRSIEGVWLLQVQRRDCQTGNPIGPAGHGLLTFASGGTISETTAPPAGPAPLPTPFFRSPGHGVWQRLNWEKYTAAIINQRLNADGTFAGWTRLRATFQLRENGNEITSTGSFEFIDPSGNAAPPGCSTSTGTRFE